MKICPVCNALSFDDMDTCFACLHHFSSEQEEKQRLSLPEIDISSAETIRSANHAKSSAVSNGKVHGLTQVEDELLKKLQTEYRLVISLEPVSAEKSHHF